MNRRDLLKYFGIGASIVPVVEGMPRIEAAANLIALPKVEPVTLSGPMTLAETMPVCQDFIRGHAKRNEITISLRTPDGRVHHFHGDTFVTHVRCDVIDVTTHSQTWRHHVEVRGPIEWTFKGQMIGEMIER